jgi:ABC-type antimicrobial peptide transport system permease subunit
MAAFNVTEAMNQAVQRDSQTRMWHTMVTLADSAEESALSLPQSIQGSREIRTFYQSKVRLNLKQDADLLESLAQPKITHLQVSDPIGLLQPKMLEGVWLTGEENQIVFSQLASEKYPEYDIGDTVVSDSGVTFKLVGIAEIFGSPMLYSAKTASSVNGFFLNSSEDVKKIQALEKNQKLVIKRVTRSTDMAKVIVDHFEIVFAVLLLLATVTLLIASKSVVLTTAINAQERTREIGVLKAIGASKLSVYIIVMGESLWSALLAWLLAFVIAIPLSGLVSWWVGSLLVGIPFPLALHIPAIALSLPLVVMLALLAAYIPLRRINNMLAKEALAYV